MKNGIVVALCIAEEAGAPMMSVGEVRALAGLGLEGDRYARGEGSWNKGKPGTRHVTLMNAIFFVGSGFAFTDSRRNIFTQGVELMDLIGKEFEVGEALLRGVKYSDPCMRPSKLCGKPGYMDMFHDRGGLVADVVRGGYIRQEDVVIPPKKNY